MGLLDKVTAMWSQDMAIDLGTANTLVASANAYINALNKMIIKRDKTAPGQTQEQRFEQKVRGI